MNRRGKCVLVFAATAMTGAGLYGLIWDLRNPFDDVVFTVDSPGANGRHLTFTPALKSNPNSKIGPTFGADYGRLRFADLDGDGVHEAVIETHVPFFGGLEFYFAERHVLKLERLPSGELKVRHIRTDFLDEEYSDAWGATFGQPPKP
jgi:hypothetical protein